MYSVLDYSSMMRDGVRMEAYERALSQLIKPEESIVVDIGAGTGVVALLAARMGARVVHAVEANPAIHLLRDLARENGLEARIRVHPVSSFDLDLGERADIVVSDLRGSFPLNGTHAETLRDAAARFLRPEGVLLPARDEFFVAGFESFDVAARLEHSSGGFERHGFRGTAAYDSVVQTQHRDVSLASIVASDVVTTEGAWGLVDYRTWQGGVVEGNVSLEATRKGTVHGLVLWFRATVYGDIRYANAPGSQMAYARLILPLVEPLRVIRGQALEITLRVDERGEQWAWETTTTPADGATRTLRQASFFGTPTSFDEMLRRSSSFTPKRSRHGEIAAYVLAAMDGKTELREIEARTIAAFPGCPPAELARHVRETVTRHAR